MVNPESSLPSPCHSLTHSLGTHGKTCPGTSEPSQASHPIDNPATGLIFFAERERDERQSPPTSKQ
ncbi:hypothetical protein OnM2_099022 [Erysiphe neolycopersici]|uniref:Uncharacterized protein n=1 Tax=Erysiphe neolycopersici TaxID=212602 RepID=A0A420H9S6_9PEZI|nr:hypothetical protein OnM2_099022 [Erysiphe neolycopersici]